MNSLKQESSEKKKKQEITQTKSSTILATAFLSTFQVSNPAFAA
jgi:hypothetical protein